MRPKTNTTSPLLIVLILIFTFPIWIGILGGLIGAVAGIFGAGLGIMGGIFGVFVGIIAGVFGAIASVIGGIFDFAFDFNWPFYPWGAKWILITVILVALAYKMQTKRTTK